jgi:hypothetical protein
MFDTTHHSAFDKWWEFASQNYVTWDKGNPVAIDLYYDPVVDEHVGREGPSGIIAPAWYFAPQKPEVAMAGWKTIAAFSGVLDDGPLNILDNPGNVVPLLQLSGEFAEPDVKKRIWDAAEEYLEPTWNDETGEFTLGLGLNETHPRGQLNARLMAGWVCTEGAWSQIFNQPNLNKFDEPTIEGVDFPLIALSEARWDGTELHLAAHPQNAKVAGTKTVVKLTNVESTNDWVMILPNGNKQLLADKHEYVEVELVADNKVVVLRRD